MIIPINNDIDNLFIPDLMIVDEDTAIIKEAIPYLD